MRKMGKKITCAILAATMLGTAFTGCGKEEKLDGTQTVMTIGEEKVTLGLAHLMLRESQAASEDYMDTLASVYGGTGADYLIWDDTVQNGDITYGQQQKENTLGSLCEYYALKMHAEDYDVVITEEERTKIEAAAEKFMTDNTQETIDTLGVAKSDIVEYLELVTVYAKIYEPMVADVDRKVKDEEANQTKVTFAAISTLGTEKDKDGKTISLTDAQKAEKKELMQKLIDAIKEEKDIAKADISKIAKEISKDITVTTTTYTTADAEEQYAVNEVVWKAVEDMKDGEVCDKVLEAASSYYIVRLDATVDKEATDAKKEEIISNREVEAYKKLLEGWVAELEDDIKVDHKVWAQVELTTRQSFRFVVKEDEKKDEKK